MREVLLYGDIGVDIDPKAVVADIDAAAAAGEPLRLRINSFGGDVFGAVAITTALQRAEIEIEARVEGVAASAASLIAAAVGRVVIAPAAFMMIHDPWSITIGPATAHDRAAASLRKIGERMASIYAKRMATSPREAAALMAAETWFDSREAVDAGLADAIEGENQAAGDVIDIAARSRAALACRRRPAALASGAAGRRPRLALAQARLDLLATEARLRRGRPA